MTKHTRKQHPNSISNEYNTGIQNISNHYRRPAQRLILHLMDEHGYTLDQVAEIIGVNKQAISQNWLRGVK